MRMWCCRGNYLCVTDKELDQQPVLDCPPSESLIVLSCTVHSFCSTSNGHLTDCPFSHDFTRCVIWDV